MTSHSQSNCLDLAKRYATHAAGALLTATALLAAGCSDHPPVAAGSGGSASNASGGTPTDMIPGAGSSSAPPGAGASGTGTSLPDGSAGASAQGGQPGSTACNPDSTFSDNGAPPSIFTSACSNCHGPTGNGKGIYPSTRVDMSLADFTTLVRGGRVGTTPITTAQGKSIMPRMPAFSPAHVSDTELAAIYNYRKGPADPNAKAGAYCLARPEATWTDTQIDEAYQRGLKAWRTPGTVDQNACVFCHGPDAMEFAALGYTDSAMYRRAFTHVDQSVVDDVIDMVHALRARYHIAQPPDPAVARPFQPGGEPLPGASAAERDSAFGQELKDMGLTLMGPPINSAADAKKAWAELLGLNLRTLRVGIPMNHYTEDIFNNDGATPTCTDFYECDDHGTIADWISDTPVLSADKATALYPLHDAYLKDPTLENLKAILHASPRDDVMWFKQKYLAVQVANFLFRQEAGGMPLLDKLPSVPFPIEKGNNLNAIWMVGANLRDFIHNVGTALPTGAGKFAVPTETIPGLTRNNASEQLQRLIVPWFWLGFSFDPSTMNVEPDYVAEGDEYFTQETFLDNGAAPIHAAFIVSKRTVEVMAQPTLPRSPNVFPFQHPDLGRFPVTPMTMRSGYFPELANFAEEKNFNTINNYQLKYTPTDAAHKALYQTYTANMYRMFMWTLVAELQTTPEIWNPNILKGKITKAEIFLTQPEVAATNGTQDVALIAQARDLVSKAKVNN
jgi:mono/diheme cytochrome c family protein